MIFTCKRAASLLLILFANIGLSVEARELFEGDKAPEFTRGQYIYGGDQIGGYQIYGGDGNWQFEDAKVYNSSGSADSIPIGVIRMTMWSGGELAAAQTVTTNLRSNNGAYWSGSPCDGESLAKRNRGRGRYDDCMTIKAESTTVGGKPVSFLIVNTVQTQTGGRYYVGTVAFNVAYLGFPGTVAAEWNKYTVEADPLKAAVLAKVVSWAERYQDAVAAQMDYRRPSDTFAAVPKLRELRGQPSQPSATTAKSSTATNKGVSYSFCEATKTMVPDGGGNCPEPQVVTSEPAKTVEKRLQELKDLLAKGLIDKDAYQRKRDEILKAL